MRLEPVRADHDERDFSQLVLTIDKERELTPSEEIRLKFDALNPVLLGLLRTLFKDFYREKHGLAGEVLLTKPTDLGFERFVLAKYVGLMEFLLYMKERKAALEEDLALLSDPALPYQTRFAVQYRAEKKKIIRSNIDLARFVLGIADQLSATLLSPAAFKALCLAESDGEAHDQYAKWVQTPEFDREAQYFRRRL